MPPLVWPLKTRSLKVLHEVALCGSGHMLRHPYPRCGPEPYDEPFADDAGKVSPALFQRPAGCKDPGKSRHLSVIRFGVLDDPVSGVFECRVDILRDHGAVQQDCPRI